VRFREGEKVLFYPDRANNEHYISLNSDYVVINSAYEEKLEKSLICILICIIKVLNKKDSQYAGSAYDGHTWIKKLCLLSREE